MPFISQLNELHANSNNDLGELAIKKLPMAAVVSEIRIQGDF
jgi:hypothetical protein